jgi:hypothetical protein
MSKPTISEVKASGGSLYVILTKELREMGLKEEDYVKVYANEKKITITRLEEVA